MRRMNGREWTFVMLFIAFDIAVLWAAKTYFGKESAPDTAELSEQDAEALFAMPDKRETRAIDDLERTAGSGSWDSVEESRLQMVESFRSRKTRPSRGTALYFFPELLPETSLEREFARNEIEPGLAALRTAHENGETAACEKAYGLLRHRIENYELGATVETDDDGAAVSPEARRFLRLYGRLTGLPLPYPNEAPPAER